MIVTSGPEGSQVTDALYGKPIFVSTSARILFRAANSAYKSVKNDVLNKNIADLFSKATPEERKFTPKSGNDAFGEFRVSSGLRFISIVDASSIKVISAKGSVPNLPAPPPTSTVGKTASKHASTFESFALDHLSEFAQKKLKVSEDDFKKLRDFLLPYYDGDIKIMVKDICSKDKMSNLKNSLFEQLQIEQYKSQYNDINQQSSATNWPIGIPLGY